MLAVISKFCAYISNETTVIFGCQFSSNTCNKVGNKLKFLFTMCTRFGQCTYLGYVLLETPHEHVLHGPLLNIYWLRLCPHLGAHVRSHAIRGTLFIVLMTAAHISPNIFSFRKFLSNIQELFHSTYDIIHTYTSHLHDIYTFYFTCLIQNLFSSDLHGRLAALSSLWPIQYRWLWVIIFRVRLG